MRRAMVALVLALILTMVGAAAEGIEAAEETVVEAAAETAVEAVEGSAEAAETGTEAEAAPAGEAEGEAEDAVAGEDEAAGESEAAGEDAVADESEVAGEGETAENARGLEVYFFELERVDAILIRCESVTCFVDVGFKRDATPALAYMRALGVTKLDCYIATHAHADHVGGAATIIHEMRPNAIYIPHKKVWPAILADGSAKQRKTCESIGYTILKHGDIFPLGGATIKCLGPINIRSCDPSETKENDNSLIFKLIYGQRSFLFTGDTSDAVLREVNRKYPGGLRCDVFKNPHHNGAHAEDVVAMVQPKLTVFQTSDDHQPDGAYVRLLKRAGSESLVTCPDRDGNVLVRTDGVSLDMCCGYPLTKVSLNQGAGTLAPGQQVRLTGTLKPSRKADPERGLIWTSSDTGVAKVSGGLVTAVGEGVAVITATSINGLSDSVEVRVAATGILIRPTSVSLKVGEARQIETKLSPEGDSSLTVTWESGDEGVAVVTQSGEVLAAGPGETTVVARLSNGAEAVCNVAVSEVPAKEVKLDRHSLKLKAGEQTQLAARVSPSETTDKRLEWASSDESVATVDAFGNVTAVGKGAAKIGVRAASGAYDICKVKVE